MHNRLPLYLMFLSLGLFSLFLHGLSSSSEHYTIDQAIPHADNDWETPDLTEEFEHEDEFMLLRFSQGHTTICQSQCMSTGQLLYFSPFLSPQLPPPKA